MPAHRRAGTPAGRQARAKRHPRDVYHAPGQATRSTKVGSLLELETGRDVHDLLLAWTGASPIARRRSASAGWPRSVHATRSRPCRGTTPGQEVSDHPEGEVVADQVGARGPGRATPDHEYSSTSPTMSQKRCRSRRGRADARAMPSARSASGPPGSRGPLPPVCGKMPHSRCSRWRRQSRRACVPGSPPTRIGHLRDVAARAPARRCRRSAAARRSEKRRRRRAEESRGRSASPGSASACGASQLQFVAVRAERNEDTSMTGSYDSGSRPFEGDVLWRPDLPITAVACSSRRVHWRHSPPGRYAHGPAATARVHRPARGRDARDRVQALSARPADERRSAGRRAESGLRATVPVGFYDIQAIREQSGQVAGIRWVEHTCSVQALPGRIRRHLQWSVNFQPALRRTAGGGRRPGRPADRELTGVLSRERRRHTRDWRRPAPSHRSARRRPRRHL